MGYRPRFGISSALLARVEAIAALRERIQGAAVQVGQEAEIIQPQGHLVVQGEREAALSMLNVEIF